MSRPDENALADAALELVLPEAAELSEIAPSLLAPRKLPGLWSGDEITVQAVFDYFNGSTMVQVDRGAYQEPMRIPKATSGSLEKSIAVAVENSTLWLLSGPASILGEPIPPGVLNANARLCPPPSIIAAAEILPENLPDAWKDDACTGLSVASALSMKAGKNLPWKTVKDVISGALHARFLQIAEDPSPWPCDFPSAQLAKFKVTMTTDRGGDVYGPSGGPEGGTKVLVASSDLGPSEVQDLGDIVPELLKIKAKVNAPIRFHVRIELGDGKTLPSQDAANELNEILKKVKEDFQLL